MKDAEETIVQFQCEILSLSIRLLHNLNVLCINITMSPKV